MFSMDCFTNKEVISGDGLEGNFNFRTGQTDMKTVSAKDVVSFEKL